MIPAYLAAICPGCEDGFTAAEWTARHTAPDGADVHARCCPDPDCTGDLPEIPYHPEEAARLARDPEEQYP